MTRVSDTRRVRRRRRRRRRPAVGRLRAAQGRAARAPARRNRRAARHRPWGVGILGFAPPRSARRAARSSIRDPRRRSRSSPAAGPTRPRRSRRRACRPSCTCPRRACCACSSRRARAGSSSRAASAAATSVRAPASCCGSSMVETLLDVARRSAPDEFHVLFAGGIHDALLGGDGGGDRRAARRARREGRRADGHRVSVHRGGRRDRRHRARFQEEAIALRAHGHCSRPAGPRQPLRRHAVRARRSRARRARSRERACRRRDPGDARAAHPRAAAHRLEGPDRDRPTDGELAHASPPTEQQREGMYMLGQVATLRSQVTRIAAAAPRGQPKARAALLRGRLDAHRDAGPAPRRARRHRDRRHRERPARRPNRPAEYWENILDKVDAITEIPSHRWDWRLYFDADRNAKDKIYSKWGGFLDDMLFDPMRYGIPPKSLHVGRSDAAMALEVARRSARRRRLRTSRPFDRERTSVISAPSGGAGDVGAQYGVRAELPRFNGELPSRRGRPPAGVDRGLVRRHPPQRHRRPRRQPAQLRRRQLHRRCRLRLVAGGGLPGRQRAGGGAAATSSSPAASTPCRARSATSASARRRRCRRAAAARPSTHRPTASSSPRASRWWR